MTKKLVPKERHYFDLCDIEGNITSVISFLQDLQQLGFNRLERENSYGDEYWHAVKYGLETDEEYEDRIGIEKAQRARKKKAKEDKVARQRKEYEKLKAIFEEEA